MKLRKHHSLVDDAWFCDLITVRGPGACEEAAFPCYRWVQGQGVLSLPEGTGEGGAGTRGQPPGNRPLGKVGAGQTRWGQDRDQGNVPQSPSYTQDKGLPGSLEGKVGIWRRPLPRGEGPGVAAMMENGRAKRVERRSACGGTSEGGDCKGSTCSRRWGPLSRWPLREEDKWYEPGARERSG